ncbi:class I SAM-dependent methyltransferase [Helicovermis profundi]|uniref:SAM-dependent methyltransferase n=1 Tax=Helicovermis profundi TaxID=3065157 RepID=A0AAU9E0X0_9FIRM|nr:SAM-dependent methyltransferase [Clostridia bacterium S502]
MEKVYSIIKEIIDNDKIIYAVFTNVKKGVEKEFSTVKIKPMLIKNNKVIQVEYHYTDKVKHDNLEKEHAIEELDRLLKTYFKQAIIYTISADYQILISKKGVAKIIKKAPSRNSFDLSHNRKKNYIIEENIPCPFLFTLGVMDETGKVFKKSYDKFRQINRYLEFISDSLPYLKQNKTLQIVDFGSGKAYLTFAMYYYFVVIKKLNVNIIGLDLKTDVIELCKNLAVKLKYDGLNFVQGDIKNYEGLEKVDMVVSLHACDTATDAALAKSIEWDADVIFAVPCCQHELFKKIHNDVMAPLENHGLIKERISSLITDSVRVNALEVMGYNTQVLEFIDMEHTPKNILIRAYKTGNNNKKAIKEYKEFTEFWGIRPYLEEAIGEKFTNKLK